MSKGMKDHYKKNPYDVALGLNECKFVTIESVRDIEQANLSDGNSKVGATLEGIKGKVVAIFNFPIEYTCIRSCECYKGYYDEKTGKYVIPCYACHGCFNFPNNQAIYSENYKMFKRYMAMEDGIEKLVKAVNRSIRKKVKFFRWFECGDIPFLYHEEFITVMCRLAELNPDIKFWAYTKKYRFVNQFVEKYGLKAIPKNLVILFSHWRNHDGSFFPMDNPYSFPTSEFIPFGCEEDAEKVTHICPCSNPDIYEQCINCTHPCYELKFGESMALLEHSTERTAERDKAVKEAHKRIAEKTA